MVAPWPTVARRENALPRLNRRHNREHQVPESEAELLALDCWPRWRRGGEFARRLRWRLVASWLRAGGEASTGEQESGRDGVERSAALRQMKAGAWEWGQATAAARREFSAAVGACASGEQGNGVGLGRGERSAGWRE